MKATTFSTSDIVELKGVVTGYTDTSAPFSLAGLTGISIDASSAALDDLPDGLKNDIQVEVKGTCSDTACNTINATRVEGQSDFDDNDEFSIEGLITDCDATCSNFKINGIDVDATIAKLEPTTLVLRDGARVEVEGSISNNLIKATEVELRGGDAEVYAKVGSYDTATGNFELSVDGTVIGQTIAVTVTAATEIDIDEGQVLAKDAFVGVRGFENVSGGITATKVEVRDEDDVIVQGNLQSFTSDVSIKVLGVSFIVNLAETKFEDSLDQSIPQTTFASTPIGTLVKVKDKQESGNTPPNGIADEIEIEIE